jgi:hypothetical protein
VGLASLAAAAVKSSLDYTSYGFSLTNAFESPSLIFYNGHPTLSRIVLRPSIFQFQKLKLNPNIFSAQLNLLFSLSGDFTNGLSVLAPYGSDQSPTQADVEEVLNNYTAVVNSTDDSVNDVSDDFVKTWTVQAYMTGQAKVKFTFSKIPYLRLILPDSNNYEIAQVSVITTTGEVQIDGQMMYPGISFFVGTGVVALIQGLLKDMVTFLGSVLVSPLFFGKMSELIVFTRKSHQQLCFKTGSRSMV